MLEKEFAEIMQEYANEIEISLDKQQIDKFYTYMKLLLEWNEKINLTAIIQPEEIILKHFIDSMTIAPYLEKNAKLIDVGTGAGFPGIPLKIIREDIQITLLDSLNKRINFLNHVIKQLQLTNIQTIHSRVEELGKDKRYRENFHYATSRAVANLSTLAEYLIPLVKIEGCCISMKGANIQEEIQKSKNAISLLGGKIEKIKEFQLPKSDMDRNLVIIRKVKNTPSKYPRKAGLPTKDPIK